MILSRSCLRLRDGGFLEYIYLTPDMPRVRERDLDALIEHGTADTEAVA